MMIQWDYICCTGIYLYQRCYEHKKCFCYKWNVDFAFVKELQFMIDNGMSFCSVDFFKYLEQNINEN